MRRLWLFLLIVAGMFGAEQSLAQQSSPEQGVTVQTPAPNETHDPALPDKEKPKGIIHDQDIKDIPEVHAKHPCNNHSWAASLAAVLSVQNASIQQDFWVDKFYGGDVCLDQMGAPEDLIRKTEGEYVLDDARHVELKLEYFAGLPSNSSVLLVPIMKEEILIVFLDGRAELLVGAMWDEYLSPRGERMIDLKELHLLDPLQPAEKQRVTLDASNEEISKVSGYMKVKATVVHQQYWPK
jgi:hypothetical protein